MPIRIEHHMLLAQGEKVLCTVCKQFKGHMTDMFIQTVQAGGRSEVTETVCDTCHKKGKK